MHGILYIIDNYKDPFAGTEGQLHQLIQGLDRKCFRPKLILFQPSDYIAREGFPCEVEVLNIQKLSSPRTWARLWQFARHARRDGYDLAHIFFNDASIVAPLFLKMHGFKVLVSRRDMGFWYNRVNLLLLRMNRRFVDAVVANSNAVQRIVHEREGFALRDIDVIANGYPAASAPSSHSCPPELDDLKQTSEFMIGLVANIRPVKRIQDAVEAVAKVRRQGCFVSLVVIGGGDATDLKALAQEQGVSQHVRFLGARCDVERFLPFFSIGLLCSESEGFSNAIIEYLRAGIPVVCTATGGNQEIIREGRNGYLYPVGNVERLARLLQTMVENPALRKQLTDGALASVRGYTLERMLNAHLALYSRLLNCPTTKTADYDSAVGDKKEHWPAKSSR